MKITLQLTSSQGVENFLDKKVEFVVEQLNFESIKKQAQALQKDVNFFNHKWAVDGIQDCLYLEGFVDDKQEGRFYHQLDDYLDSLM